MSDVVSELKELLGSPVVFIDWPKGVKGAKRKWGNLTVADMTPEYLAKLQDGNIGVALGEKSCGLLAIDIDDDALVEPFLALNSHLSGTLQTRGARGRVFWVRANGEYDMICLRTLGQCKGHLVRVQAGVPTRAKCDFHHAE
jgi:hypothetical protein